MSFATTKKLLVAAVAVMFSAFGLSGNALASSGVFSCTPGTFSLVTGSTIILDIHEDSGANPVSNVQMKLTYPSDTVELESIDGSGSGFDSQLDNSGGGGVVSIARAKTGTAVTGDQRVVRIALKATTLGYARMTLESGTLAGADNQNVLATPEGTTMATVWVVSPNPGGSVDSTASVNPAPASETPATAATPIPTTSSTSGSDAGQGGGSSTGSGSGSGTALPDTGATGVVSGVMGLGTLGYGVRTWLKSRRSLKDTLKSR